MYSMGPSGVGYGYWGCAAGITRIMLFNAHMNPLAITIRHLRLILAVNVATSYHDTALAFTVPGSRQPPEAILSTFTAFIALTIMNILVRCTYNARPLFSSDFELVIVIN